MISIIGAGPAGCYLGYLLAKAGKNVQIFEEHEGIGEPVQCTGIVTNSIKGILNIGRDCVINEINKVKIFAPNGKYIELKLKNKNLIIDRKKFDNYVADLAVRKGAKIFLNYKFVDFKDKVRLKYKGGNEISAKTDYLVGADGPLSSVAKSIGLFSKRKFMTGLQARVKLKNQNYVEFYPFFGSFGWIVPENKEIVRLGVASYKNVKKDFDKFIKFKKLNRKKIIDKQGGLIPIYNPSMKIQKENVFLVGDAATQVKATTGGGVIQGMIGAKCLADAICNNGCYSGNVKKRIGKELWLHLKVRNVLDKFREKDWNYLIDIFNKEKNKQILENMDRDNLSKFFFNMLIKEPSLLRFGRYLF